jgi:cytochrome c
MLRKLAIAVALLFVIGAGAFWILTIPKTVSPAELGPRTANLENGRILFHAGGCASCHATPKQEDKSRLGGGLALPTRFGTFYAPNISPDPNDGIGTWTEAQFLTAFKEGTSPSGEHLYPAFPYTSYRHVATDDLRDLFAYLKTLPAVAGRAPDHQLPLPFSMRRGLGIWKLLFLDAEAVQPGPSMPAVWMRGAYLVNGAGHCAECHSPRNFAGAIIPALRFMGGPNPAAAAGCRTSPSAGSRIGPSGTSPICSKAARHRKAIALAPRWSRWCAAWRSCRPRIAPQSRLSSNRCRRSRASSLPASTSTIMIMIMITELCRVGKARPRKHGRACPPGAGIGTRYRTCGNRSFDL